MRGPIKIGAVSSLSFLAQASSMKYRHICFTAVLAVSASLPAVAQDERAYPSPSNAATYNETRLTAQENELRALNGRLEQLEFSIRKYDQVLQKMQSDIEMRLAKIESTQAAAATAAAQAPAPAQQSAQAAAAPVVDPNGTLGALKMQGNKVTGGVNKPQSSPLPTVPPDYGLTVEEQYERAFNFLREADYAEAEESFKAFIEKNPKDKLAENAKYWYGETLYVRGLFDAAAVAFADAYQHNPLGAKAPDSLLKLGISLAALNKTADACVTFTELKLKYPKMAPAIKARADEERAKLKCPAQRR